MTLLISVENGFSARYLLRTGLLERLGSKIPIVVAAPNAHEEYFRDFLAARGVQVIPQPSVPVADSRSARTVFELIRYYGLPTLDYGSNIDVKYQEYLERRPMRRLLLNSFDLGVKLHRSHWWARRLVSAAGDRFDVSAYRRILKQYNVALVVVDGIGSVGPHAPEWARAARGLARSLTVITNWDHPTTKGYRSRLTDHYLVWSPAMQKELEVYHDVPGARIEQTGAAIFDVYARANARLTRQQVCEKFGLDPARPIVLYISNSPVNFPHNYAIATFLAQMTSELPNAPQLLVRLHPLFLRASAAAELAQHRQLAETRGVAYSIPRVLSQTLMPDMDADETCISASLVATADVVISLFSTMQLDACICDKPVVNIGFDWDSGSRGSQQAARFQYYDHLRRVVASKAVQVATSREELMCQIRTALEHPRLQSKQQSAIVEKEAGIVDGGAVDRIGTAILREYESAMQNTTIYV